MKSSNEYQENSENTEQENTKTKNILKLLLFCFKTFNQYLAGSRHAFNNYEISLYLWL